MCIVIRAVALLPGALQLADAARQAGWAGSGPEAAPLWESSVLVQTPHNRIMKQPSAGQRCIGGHICTKGDRHGGARFKSCKATAKICQHGDCSKFSCGAEKCTAKLALHAKDVHKIEPASDFSPTELAVAQALVILLNISSAEAIDSTFEAIRSRKDIIRGDCERNGSNCARCSVALLNTGHKEGDGLVCEACSASGVAGGEQVRLWSNRWALHA